MTAAAARPLDEEQLRVLGETRKLTRKLRVARGLALTNVITLGVLSCFSVLFGAIDGTLPVMGVSLGVIAWNEARGRTELAAAAPRGARRLAWNQLGLLVVVLAYCAYHAYLAWRGADPLLALAGQSDELADALKELQSEGPSVTGIGGWARTAALVVCGAVAVVSAVVQGLTAYYYASQRTTVEALGRMPAWARALQ